MQTNELCDEERTAQREEVATPTCSHYNSKRRTTHASRRRRTVRGRGRALLLDHRCSQLLLPACASRSRRRTRSSHRGALRRPSPPRRQTSVRARGMARQPPTTIAHAVQGAARGEARRTSARGAPTRRPRISGAAIARPQDGRRSRMRATTRTTTMRRSS